VNPVGSCWNIRRKSAQFGHLTFAKGKPFSLAFEVEFARKIASLTERTVCPETWRKRPGAQPVTKTRPAFFGVGPAGRSRNVRWQRPLLMQVAFAERVPFSHALKTKAASEGTSLFERAILPQKCRYGFRAQPVAHAVPALVGVGVIGLRRN